jgi:hypothetical protein
LPCHDYYKGCAKSLKKRKPLVTIGFRVNKGRAQENGLSIDNHQFGAKVDNLRGMRQFGRRRQTPRKIAQDDSREVDKPRKERKKRQQKDFFIFKSLLSRNRWRV